MAIPMKIYNNLTRMKQEFVPVEKGKVKYYSCGPTTYDFLHVGNARALIIGDLFNRVFKVLGYDVTFVRNFTDVDDKIINRANETNVDPLELSSRFIDECLQDINSLGMLPANHMPKVSETIPEIIEMIKTLIDKEYAYEVQGEVFYSVPKFKTYGKLSKKKLEDLEMGIRVEVDKKKRHSADFVLWKPAKEGEPSWDSPWGKGRPGWHIECSVMAKKFLGNTIDLHHGGIDLVFPHHENEIAQSEAANGQDFSNYWCHHEFVNFGEEKMSKSLGNVVTIRSFIENFGGEVLRQLLISVHYRSHLDWSEEAISKSFNDLERIHQFLKDFNKKEISKDAPDTLLKEIEKIVPKMKDSFANDFNTPGALAELFIMIRSVRRDILDKGKLSQNVKNKINEVLSFTNQALGIINSNPEELLNKLNQYRSNLSGNKSDIDEAKIDQLILDRKNARASKDWGRADQIRDELNVMNIELKDAPDGTVTWRFKG